jgi:hypothetical protein
MFRIDIHSWFVMAAILKSKWPPKYKNPPIWAKFGFQVDFVIQNDHHSKPTMNINSQHHNLLGNQISPKSEDLFIWGPFCTLYN